MSAPSQIDAAGALRFRLWDGRLDMTGTANTYADGYAYGRKIAEHMAPWRRQENDRHIRRSEYSTRGWDTRGYWLGVRRALRSF